MLENGSRTGTKEHMQTYTDFTSTYRRLIHQTHLTYEFESAPRGMKVHETLGGTFKITNPRNRLLYIKERQFSLSYMIAECLWYFMGDNKTEWISNYSSFWKNISDDGVTANSAYGARIFKPNLVIANGSFVQWDWIKEELTKDPDSRRAVIHIRNPIDSVHAKLDMPCTLALQFFIRDKKLHMVVHMRSSDLVFGIAYDIPAFTMMQELLALELKLELGTYMHISNSLHIYERHFEMCDKIIEGGKNMFDVIKPMPSMPSKPPVELLDKVQGIARMTQTENEVRSLATASELFFTEEYWRDWAKILISHRAGKLGYKQLKKDIILSTSFQGYHYYVDQGE